MSELPPPPMSPSPPPDDGRRSAGGPPLRPPTGGPGLPPPGSLPRPAAPLPAGPPPQPHLSVPPPGPGPQPPAPHRPLGGGGAGGPSAGGGSMDESGGGRRVPIWAWIAAGVFLVTMIGGAILLLGAEDDDDTAEQVDDTAVRSATTEPDDTSLGTDLPTATSESDSMPTALDGSTPRPTLPTPPSTEATVPETSEGDDEPDPRADGEIDGAPTGRSGTHDDPVAVGDVADIGGGWRMQVLEVIGDGTSIVTEAYEFNDPPPVGSQFTLVRVALGYFGVDEPTSLLYPTINLFGADEAELDRDCGLIPDDVVTFTDVFAGSVTIGNVCAVTTPADLDALQISAHGSLFGFDEDPVFLATTPVPPTPAEPSIEPLAGPQPGAQRTADRRSPTPIGTPVDLGDGWTFSVDAAAVDITDEILSEYEFNDPPPDGWRFVGLDVTYAYDGPEPSATPIMVTVSAVGSSNRGLQGLCGATSTEIDRFTELLPGGSVSGRMCLVVPAADLVAGTWLVYADAGFDQEPTFFAVG